MLPAFALRLRLRKSRSGAGQSGAASGTKSNMIGLNLGSALRTDHHKNITSYYAMLQMKY